MCTAVLLRRPGHDWPLLFAGNRDEMKDRAWLPPGRHWPDRPEVVGGLDRLSGGSWLALNDHGVLAAVLNRTGSLGPKRGKRTRGELVTEALDATTAAQAAEQLTHLNASAYRSFNLVIADRDDAFWLRHRGNQGGDKIEIFELMRGISMLTAYDVNEPDSPRISSHLASFEHADAPDPEWDDWESWQDILRRRGGRDPNRPQPDAAMTVVFENGFETVSSSLIALPAANLQLDDEAARPRWLFAPGRPDLYGYESVEL